MKHWESLCKWCEQLTGRNWFWAAVVVVVFTLAKMKMEGIL